jgi:hypothetical protein
MAETAVETMGGVVGWAPHAASMPMAMAPSTKKLNTLCVFICVLLV